MAKLMDYTRYLAKEIGPRPAGTEEEQQAALYITERFQKEAGFTANIEEFNSVSNASLGNAILALVAIVATLLGMIFSVLSIPAFICAAAAAVVYVLEALDRPVLSRVLSNGASQNVVAKYQPNPEAVEAGRGRARKIILVAHYDTGRVTPPLVERAESLGLPLAYISIGGVVLAAFLLLIRVFVASAGGIGLVLLNILSVIALLACALPVAKAALLRTAPYNEGANNNATGAAALIEIARRISRGSVSEADLVDDADGVTIHGEAAAYEAGLVPEGAQIRYEADLIAPPASLGEHDELDRLIAAKAAIAALTGKPVERKVYGSVADKLVYSHLPEGAGEDAMPEGGVPDLVPAEASNGPLAPVPQAAQSSQMPQVDAQGRDLPADADGFENAPSWFIAAQQNAKKNAPEEGEAGQVQRSKYTEAMENAERGRVERERELADAERAQREDEARASIEASREAASPQPEGAPHAAGADEPAVGRASAPAASPEGAPELDFPGQQRESHPSRTRGAGVGALFGGADEERPAVSTPGDPAATIAHAPVPTVRQAIDLPEVVSAGQASHSGDFPASAGSTGPASSADSGASGGASARASKLQKLRASVPSLSGLIDPVPSDGARPSVRKATAQAVPSVVNVPTPAEPAAAGSASAPAPATAQAAASDDAASSRAQAAPVDYDMEVPTTRAGGFLDKLRGRGGADLKETPQEWLDVDEDFDARSVGRARGSWESFRDEFDDEDDGFGEFGTGDDERGSRWQGGAYSRLQLGHVDMRSGVDAPADEMIPDEPPETDAERSITGEIERIYHFRNPQFNTEIWFVAMGSDNEAHSGVKAFIAEHADDLRGSMVVEVESLGLGTLSVASEEGRVRKVKASSRIKRYTRTATQATGISLDQVSLAGSDSIASIIQKAGYQSMHLFGAEGGKVAMKGSADDVLDNVEEFLLDEHVNFVFELLKR